MDEIKINCPYCKSAISILVDLGEFGYCELVQDCSVCCRPIELTYNLDEGEVRSFEYHTIEGNEF